MCAHEMISVWKWFWGSSHFLTELFESETQFKIKKNIENGKNKMNTSKKLPVSEVTINFNS